MDVLARLLSGGGLYAAGAPGPMDDYWYGPVAGAMSQAGMRVDPEGARKVSAWYRGRDLLATALAMLPLQIFERLSNDAGANVAKGQPLYDIVHRKPNPWQDSFQWRRQKMFHLIDYGNGYDRIVPGARGFVHELHPIHPSLVRVEQQPSGRVLYYVRDPRTSQSITYTQDEIFHLCGATDDGVVGKGILDYARDSLGTALATESYAARIYGQGTLNGGVIENPAVLDDEASKRMAKTFITKPGDWHLPKVLEQGSKWIQNNMTPENAQMLLSRKFSIDDIARWLGVPPHMIGSLDRSTNNNIEQQGQEFVTYSLGPWLSLFEFAINDQLVLATDKYFAEFTRDALVRGDIAARWSAYQVGVTTGVVTRNEVRRKENMNRLDGLDEPLDPAFLTGSQGQQQPSPKKSAKPPAENSPVDDPPSKRARAIAQESAARVLRKEVSAVQKLAVRHAADADAFAAAVAEFYVKHSTLVASTLQVSDGAADEYCAGQASQVVSGNWMSALDQWQDPHYAAGLAALALEDIA